MKPEQTKNTAAAVRVFARPHPFAAENGFYLLPAGLTLAEMARKVQPDPLLQRHLRGYINDLDVPQEKWHRLRPKAGAEVRFCAVPMGGGGGKNPLRTVLSLAILASTSFLGSAVAATAFGQASFLGITGARLVSGALSFAGRLALNALAPPPRRSLSSPVKASPTLFIQGAQNRIDPFGKVPQILGRHRMVPVMGAKPFTETFGDDQYLRMLFVWGYGPLEISDLKIGETPLSEFKEVETEHRYGFPEDAPLTLYAGSVIQNDLQILLRESGGYHIRTTAADAEEISVDITFPRGLMVLAGSGARQPRNVVLEVQYAPAGTEEWSTEEILDVTGSQNNALRKSVRFIVPKGQYDVRIRRVTEDSEDDAVFDETVWTALRTLRYEAPVAMAGLAVTALRIKASDQLSGVIDRFNGVVQSVVPDWDGENWVPRATGNPASLFRHVLQGAANARPLPDSRIDLAVLQDWHALCTEQEREFNAVIDYQASVRDVLADIAAAGRASPSVIDGKWGVVIDRPQTVPVQHFTPRNSSGFQGEKHFDTPPHALRVRFANREKYWQQDEMLVYDDGYDAENAVRFETLDLPGITDPAQVWRDARYHIATARLRGETYAFTVDIEHLVCTRGDLIRLTHDVPLFGVQSARVKAVAEESGFATGVVLDEEITMQAGRDYSVRFRRGDGTTLVRQVVTLTGATATLQFAEAVAAEEAPLAGDLAMFGETGQESAALIVQSIRPGPDLTARLICVDAAPEVHLADQGAIPAFDSHITVPQELLRPPRPEILSVQSGPEVLALRDGGLFAPRIVLRFAPPDAGEDLELKVKIRDAGAAGGSGEFTAAAYENLSANTVAVTDVRTGGLYDLRCFYIRKNGWASEEALLPNYYVTGTGGAPSDVAGFRLSVMGDTAFLSWEAVPDIDLSHYVLRFSNATAAASWHEASDMLPQIERGASSASVPALVGTYLLKAVDMQGEQSAVPAAVVSTVAGLSAYNAVAVLTENPQFAGVCDNMAAADGMLRLSGRDSIDDWGSLDGVQRFDIGLEGLAAQGSYLFADIFDLGAVYHSTLSATLVSNVLDLSAVVDEWASVDGRINWDSASGGGTWRVRLQLRMTEDNPADSEALWTAWEDFIVGDYTARGFAFRLLAESEDPFVTPVISGLSVKIDMPDRVEGRENILPDSAGETILFDRAFRDVPAIAVSAQDMATGDYYSITETAESGFHIRFFNAAGEGISRRFDYVAKGYGIRR